MIVLSGPQSSSWTVWHACHKSVAGPVVHGGVAHALPAGKSGHRLLDVAGIVLVELGAVAEKILRDRDPELDIYNIKQPFDPAFIKRYREAQLARVRRITGWVKDTLEELRRRGGAEVERGFVTHRTLADPRFLDPALDPNDRPPGWCYLGNPETVNSGPVGLARFSTLRAWLSQWSIDDTQGDGVACASVIRAPLLFIENSADDAVPQPHCREVFDAAVSPDKRYELMEGATHYYKGQPELLAKATDLTRAWLSERGLAGR